MSLKVPVSTPIVSVGDLDFVGKVAVRHPFSALGQPLNGGDQRLGQQEGEKHGDDQAEVNASTISVISSLLRADTLAPLSCT